MKNPLRSLAGRIILLVFQIASTLMRDAKGRSIGRLFAQIGFDQISPTLESRELGESGNVFLVDRDMRILNPPAVLDPNTRWHRVHSYCAGSRNTVAIYHDTRAIRRQRI